MYICLCVCLVGSSDEASGGAIKTLLREKNDIIREQKRTIAEMARAIDHGKTALAAATGGYVWMPRPLLYLFFISLSVVWISISLSLSSMQYTYTHALY